VTPSAGKLFVIAVNPARILRSGALTALDAVAT
jgi:hypothetical protein